MTRLDGTSSAFDSALADRPITSSSSRNISPGCTGLIPFLAFMAPTSSVIVHDLHIPWPVVLPTETDSPLRVDPYAVPTGPVPLQRLQPAARQACQVLNGLRAIEISKTSRGLVGEPLEFCGTVAFEETPGPAVPETSNHRTSP